MKVLSLPATPLVAAPRPLSSAQLCSRPTALPPRRLAPIAAAPADEAPSTSAPAPAVDEAVRPELVTPAWQHAIDLLSSGESFTTPIVSVNKSGAIIRVGTLNGFVPYKLMNRALLGRIDQMAWSQNLVGRELTVKVTQVVVPERRLVCSQKAAMLDKASRELSPGDIIGGNVTSLHNFGAFIEVEDPPELAGTDVILPLPEISWEWVSTVNVKLTKGQKVRAVVKFVNPPPQSKVVVSTKRLEEDPLKETLDKLLPLSGTGGFAAVGSVAADVPTGVEDVLEELAKEEGVTEVNLGRRAEEQRTVSQDLELWISKEAVADGFSLVARAGRVVQEINVVTEMSAAEMRAAVSRVLKRVN
jgi:predicted RNA-binding protein with RPS1 domain